MSAQSAPPITLPTEPVLDGVHDEDKSNVRNAIYVLHALKLCVSWSVSPKDQGYEIIGTIDTKNNFFIEHRDMDLIRRVDPLRITSVGVRALAGVCSPTTISIVVFVMRKSEPIVLEEQEIVQIKRKRKFWGLG